MIRWTIAWPLLAGACTNFESVEDACKGEDAVPGTDGASEGAIQFFARLTCYRRYVGVGQARPNPRLTEAVQNHVRYLERNVVLDEIQSADDFYVEQQGRPGYTGQVPADRFDVVGYESEGVGLQTWSVFAGLPANVDAGRLVDEAIHDPLFRDPLLAPGWRSGGFERGVLEDGYEFGYLEAALYLPSQSNAFSPVSWPADEETGVPTEWFNDYFGLPGAKPPFDELPQVIGYPITFTFGSDRGGGGGENPLDIQLRDSLIVGPNGPIEHGVVFPGIYFGGDNNSTIALMPFETFEPNTDYIVEIDVSWVSRERLVRTITFTTDSQAGPPPDLF